MADPRAPTTESEDGMSIYGTVIGTAALEGDAFPADVLAKAREVSANMLSGHRDLYVEDIARAIMDERNRCEQIAHTVRMAERDLRMLAMQSRRYPENSDAAMHLVGEHAARDIEIGIRTGKLP
jgi:hypothetical protein